VLFLTLALARNLPAEENTLVITPVMAAASRKLSAFDAVHPSATLYPTDAKGNTWKCVPPSDWVSGFYPGCLWYLYKYKKEHGASDAEHIRSLAEKWTEGLKEQQFTTSNHDIGFMIFDSFGNAYRLTTNTSYLPIINQAAESLSTRFVPKTGMIRSWGTISDQKKQTTIIDNMMNLELLLWSSKHGGKATEGTSEDLVRIAKSHADQVIDLWFRPDGSVYHVVDLDPLTGKVLKKRTAQGKNDESAWARGQTWAIYGFGTMYEYTHEPRYLAASQRAADYYINHLPADFVPPSDFQSTLTGLEFKDSSAAAVATSALIRLSQQVNDPELKKKYFTVAEQTLHALTHPPYLAEENDKAGLLNHGARNYCEDPKSPLTDTALIFGDYYLLEALLRYENAEKKLSQAGSN